MRPVIKCDELEQSRSLGWISLKIKPRYHDGEGMKRFLRAIGKTAWIRLGIRRRIVKMFYPACGSPSFQFSVPYHGVKYYGDIANAQEWHVYFFGGYELKESALMQDLLRNMQSPIVFDVGANLRAWLKR